MKFDFFVLFVGKVPRCIYEISNHNFSWPSSEFFLHYLKKNFFKFFMPNDFPGEILKHPCVTIKTLKSFSLKAIPLTFGRLA